MGHIQRIFVLLAAAATMATTVGAATSSHKEHVAANPVVDWDSLTFSLNGIRTDFMWVDNVAVKENSDDEYSSSAKQCLKTLGSLDMSPMATVFNYAQSIFEGFKVYRQRNNGKIVMFRPNRHAARMQEGARRFLLPPVPTETFLKATEAVVRANARWVPPCGKGALYIRPLLMGTGEGLGVKPSSQSTFCVYCAPVGSYFEGGLKTIHLRAVRGFSRAVAGGSGSVKASGNYAPAFLVQTQVRQLGYDEVLCLDAISGEAIEEAGASNFFAVYPNGTIVTPSLDAKTILAGVTRASIIELAEKECDCNVVEGRLTISDLGGASEAFCCGTGASITPVGSVSLCDPDGSDATDVPPIVFGDGESSGPMTRRLHKILSDLQTGEDETLHKKYGHWIHAVDP